MNLSIVLICLHYSFWAIEAKYTAAVVEFFPEQDKNLTPRERLYRNVENYIAILDELSHKSKLDIVVYPELTLTTNAAITTHADVLPYSVEVEVNETSSLCNARVSTFLTTLACAASKYDTYIVVNLYEKTPCKESEGKKCTEDGWHFYNTNVALNRNGSVISKYRKYNLFGEIYMTRPTEADVSIFETDFNETFAMFTCFDILFKQPALDLVYKHNVKSVIYPTMWYSELPFLTALQSHQQWVYVTNATFLASGANNRKRGSGGTGIYQGSKGPLLFTIVPNNKSKGLISTIPSSAHTSNDTDSIDEKAKKMDGFYLLSDNLEPYGSQLVAPYQTEVKATVCSRDEGNELCCHFEMELEWQMNDTKNHYQYHMVAFSGVRSFSGWYNGGIEVCGLIACINHTLSSCGKRFPDYDNVSWPINFKKILINAQFDFDENKIQYPNSLLSNIEPINVDAFNWTSEMNDKRINRTYTLIKPQNRLMTFAIFGRYFNRDSPPRN